ncbi:glycosyltransferase [Paraburkholderia bannensis]|uniref:glycosyltransferase n=1 Tax=Paraburkholderia bannensis TaxID=765414 RepID=UPI002AC35614|nr:glycosyltransferase [Paraburkholderia bannensis]
MKLIDFQPVMIGRDRWGDAPAGMRSVAMFESAEKVSNFSRLHHAISRNPEAMVRLLKPFDVSLIHAHFGVDAVYAQRVAESIDVPLVTTFHGFDVTTRVSSMIASAKPSWLNYMFHRRSLARNGRLFVCVSKFIRDKVLAQGFPEDRVRLHYMGVDTNAIRPRKTSASEPIVLHVGRLVEKKGCADLIDAFSKLPKRFSDARLVVVGEGPLRKSLEDRASKLGLTPRVEFMGAQPQYRVHQLMQSAMALCQPSVTARSGDAEGLGMVLLEAAASGIPVIGTRSGGIPEAVIDGQTGFLVEEHDTAALSQAIVDVLGSPALRETMGKSARSFVEKHFDVSRQSSLLSALYKEIL